MSPKPPLAYCRRDVLGAHPNTQASSSSHREAAGTPSLHLSAIIFMARSGSASHPLPSSGHSLLHLHFPGRPPRWLLAWAWPRTVRVQSPTHGEPGLIRPTLPGSPLAKVVSGRRRTQCPVKEAVGAEDPGSGPSTASELLNTPGQVRPRPPCGRRPASPRILRNGLDRSGRGGPDSAGRARRQGWSRTGVLSHVVTNTRRLSRVAPKCFFAKPSPPAASSKGKPQHHFSNAVSGRKAAWNGSPASVMCDVGSCAWSHDAQVLGAHGSRSPPPNR